MTQAVLNIKRWGNNLGVRLPAAIAKQAGLHAEQKVRVSVEDGCVIIVAADDRAGSLDDRLARFDPVRHGGEAMAAEPVGTERW